MKKEKRILFYLVAAALLLRLISLITFGFIDSGGGSDTVTYLSLARNLFSGLGYTECGLPHTVHHPFYPVLIGVFWKATGDLLFAGQLVSTLAGAFLVVPVYFRGKFLFGKRTAFYSGLLTALFPVLVYGSTEPFSESLYTFLLVSGAAVFWVAVKKKTVYPLAAAGILIGLAYLTHPAGVVFIQLFVCYLLIAQFFSIKTRWRTFILRAALLLAGFAVACLPFWVYLHNVTGRWQLSGSSHYQDLTLRLDQARGAEEGKVIFEHMELLFHPDPAAPTREGMGLTELAWRHPDQLLEIIKFNLEDGLKEARKTAGFLGIPPRLLYLLLGVGLIFLGVSFVGRGKGPEVSFLGLLFLPAIAFIIVTIEHRYFYPFIPLSLVALSRIVADRRDKILASGSRFQKVVFGVFIAALVFLMLAGDLGVIVRKWKKRGIPYEYKLMGEWMKEEIDGIEGEKVMMFRLGVSYYAGCDWNVFFWGEYPDLNDYLVERGIEYVVIDDYKLRMLHPDLRFLLTADYLPDGFATVKEFEFDGRKIRLLRFTPPAL